MLSVDQIKLLSPGDWLWIQSDNDSYYAQITRIDEDSIELQNVIFKEYTDSTGWFYFYNYGADWKAYRNKEEITYPRSRIRNEALSEALRAVKTLAESAHKMRIATEYIPHGAAEYWENAEKRYWDAYAVISDLMDIKSVKLD